MDIQVPITITDELEEDVIEATGKLNLSSGEISDIQYIDYSVSEEGLPSQRSDYTFSCGILKIEDKEVEFAIEADGDEYSVNTDELLEIKTKAAALATKASKKKVQP